jgi:hypothetical protein
MIFRPSIAQFAPTLRLRLRSAGLGQSCPSGEIWDSGACVPDCSQVPDNPTAQFACADRRAAAWEAAAIQQGQPAGQLIDPITGLPVSIPGYSPTQMQTGVPSIPVPPTVQQQQQQQQQQATLTCATGQTLWNGTCISCPSGSNFFNGNCITCGSNETFYNGSCVVNPSPPSQTTNGTTTAASPGSAQSQANGTTFSPGSIASTVQGYVSTLTSGPDLIPGIPNWLLLAGGVLTIAYVLQKK